MIAFDSVCFRYGRKIILNNLTFQAEPGKCTVLAGPNGIGKSTALSLAAGALKPFTGTVTSEGAIGFAPQDAALFSDLTARDNLRFFAGLRGASIPDEPFLPLENTRFKRVGKLSGGMQKRVSLVCADLGSPENMLLDEPCIGLDIAAQELLRNQIQRWKEEGRCILYAGHNPAEVAAICDRLVLLGKDGFKVMEREEIDDFEATLREWIGDGSEE